MTNTCGFVSIRGANQLYSYQSPGDHQHSDEISQLLDTKAEFLAQAEDIRIGKEAITILNTDGKAFTIVLDRAEKAIVAQFLDKDADTLSLKKMKDIHKRIYEQIQENATLYLFSSGGGGHKSAKDAQIEKNFAVMLAAIKETDKEGAIGEELTDTTQFISWCKSKGLINEADVLHDYLGSMGKAASDLWDDAQTAGNVRRQELLAHLQPLSDLFFGPIVFYKTLASLRNLHPKKIVSTQAMATPSILLAIRIYNILYKPAGADDVKLHLYMTDMPTEYAQHFFSSINSVFNLIGNRDLILYAPDTSGNVSIETLSGLSQNQIRKLRNRELPIRSSFVEAVANYSPKTPHIDINVTGNEEFELLKNVLRHQVKDKRRVDQLSLNKKTVQFKVDKDSNNFFLMLGSNPSKSAVEEYIEKFIAQARANPDEKLTLYAFAGKFDRNSYYKQLSEHIMSKQDWPANLRVIPLSYQGPKQLAALEMSCNTITRSGGGTAMELLVLDEIAKEKGIARKKRYIHAELPRGSAGLDPMRGIPLWEKGNYFFLQAAIGAEIATPASISLNNQKNTVARQNHIAARAYMSWREILLPMQLDAQDRDV